MELFPKDYTSDKFRVIIAGGREFDAYTLLETKCDTILKDVDREIVVLSGTARGADKLGEKYAQEKGYIVEKFPALWEDYGKGAGFMRNKDMANVADALILFWDSRSRGTKHMIDEATKRKLKIRVIKY